MGLNWKCQYEYEYIEPYLHESDGKIHSLLLDFSSQYKGNRCDEEYSILTDNILLNMQKSGYEIVDVKISTIMLEDITQTMCVKTLILYK